jgi:processive 1,2-diacylglycerol beta-glucosyltransferase
MGILKHVLFLYIAISSGHQRAAEAVMNALRQMNPRVAGHGIDSFSYAYPVVGRLVARMYLEMLEHTPQIWSYLYDNPKVEQATREIREIFNVFNKGKIYRLLKKFHPRCLVCTQAVPMTVLATLKQRGKIKVPIVGIITDYGVHSYWISRHVDLYLVGTPEIKREMVRRGVRENRILVTGIPVDPHFAAPGNRTLERERLGLDPAAPTALIMGGSKGLGPLEDTVSALRRLPARAQLMVVCGQNRSALKALHKQFGEDPAVRLFGFTKNISRLMDAADILISKPGGMTCAESLAKGLPLLIIRPIPGQEERNARYLLKNGAAERVETLDELVTAVDRLFREPERLAKLRDRARALAKPFSAYEAAEAILGLVKEPVLFHPGISGGRLQGLMEPENPAGGPESPSAWGSSSLPAWFPNS